MNKKIIFGSIFTAFLIVSIPFITVAQEQQQEVLYDELSSDPEVLLGTLVSHLQTIYEYMADNYDDLIEEYPELKDIDLQELQKNINIISQTEQLLIHVIYPTYWFAGSLAHWFDGSLVQRLTFNISLDYWV